MGFEIERSQKSNVKSQNEWEKIGFAEGNGTTTEPKTYSFIDENITTGKYLYILKQIDFDGTYEYSNEIEVEVDFIPTEYALYQNYPNPFNPATTIKYSLPYESEVKINIHNVLGQKITELVNVNQEAGNYEINWDASSLASGIYFYTIDAKSVSNQEKYTSVRKMLLIK
jgi:hypothetical protein